MKKPLDFDHIPSDYRALKVDPINPQARKYGFSWYEPGPEFGAPPGKPGQKLDRLRKKSCIESFSADLSFKEYLDLKTRHVDSIWDKRGRAVQGRRDPSFEDVPLGG